MPEVENPAAELSRSPELSVVAPMFNEESNIGPFVDAVSRVLPGIVSDFEIVLVDDGSRDRTWDAILQAARDNPHVRGISLSRNFGHQGALFAGINHARGAAVITMDGDLQHPPETIAELVRAWRSGAKVVNTRRADSADTALFKRLTSRGFYFLFSKLSGVPMEAGASDFRLLDRRALEALVSMGDADLFIRGLVGWLGFSTETVAYQARNRHSGVPKFTLRRMLRFSSGAMLSFSVVPLRFGIFVGFVTSILSFLELCYILVTYFQGYAIAGWASVMTVMSFMFGILFVLLGVIGAYLGKIYEILKNRPRFVIEKTTDLSGAPGGARPSVDRHR